MKQLIELANLAKNTNNYSLANLVFGAALATLHEMSGEGVDIAPLLSMETDNVWAPFGEEPNGDAWSTALEEWDHYALLYIETATDEELCIPIPLLSVEGREFLRCIEGVRCYMRREHKRRKFAIKSAKKRASAERDIERRIREILPEWDEAKENGLKYLDLSQVF